MLVLYEPAERELESAREVVERALVRTELARFAQHRDCVLPVHDARVFGEAHRLGRKLRAIACVIIGGRGAQGRARESPCAARALTCSRTTASSRAYRLSRPEKMCVNVACATRSTSL